MTPVRTQRLSWISWRRARSRPAEGGGLGSRETPARARGRDANRRTQVDRTPGNALFQPLLDLRQEPALARAALTPAPGEAGQRGGEIECGVVAVVGARFHGPGQRLLEGLGRVGTDLAQPERLAPQSRDHHLLRVAPLERQLAGEHFECDDAERVDVGARVEL